MRKSKGRKPRTPSKNPYRAGSADFVERSKENRRTEGALTVVTVGTPAPRP